MIDLIKSYYRARQYVVPTPEEALLWAWTEYEELVGADDADELVEEAGDLVFMLYVLAWRLDITVSENALPIGVHTITQLKELTEAVLSRKQFVRNNPDGKPTFAQVPHRISQLIAHLNTWYSTDTELHGKITPKEAMKTKMARKLHGFGPRDGAGYG